MLVLKRLLICFLALVLCLPIKADALSVSAKSAVVINGDNGEIIFSKNADQKMPMASTTKIMTGLLLCEYGNFQREITVTAEMLRVEGSSMGLLAGDKVTLHDLLYGLMLASGNDAANVIAFVVGGSLDGFVDKMNKKAKELGLKNTSFETPSGLDGENHYTTAYELAYLTRYALQNQHFAKAVSCQSATLNYGNPPYRRTLTNHNKLLKMYDGAVGVKTGFTKKSGRCLVSAARKDGKYVIAVTLNAPSDWQDHKLMLDYALSSIKQTRCFPPFESYEIPVINGTKERLTINPQEYVVNSLETENIICTVYLPKFLYAPIKKEETVGSVVYSQNGGILASMPIKSENSIELCESKKDFLTVIFDNIKSILVNI